MSGLTGRRVVVSDPRHALYGEEGVLLARHTPAEARLILSERPSMITRIPWDAVDYADAPTMAWEPFLATIPSPASILTAYVAGGH